MTEIVQAIDDWTNDYFSAYSPDVDVQLFGLCELMSIKKEQVAPVTIPERQQVSLKENMDIITWIRQVGNVNREASPDHDWGLKIGRKQTIPLRWVIAHKVALGENLIYDILNDFVNKFNISGYEWSFVGDTINVDTDHEAIYLTELGATEYEKHRVNWNLYAVQLNVEYVKC